MRITPSPLSVKWRCREKIAKISHWRFLTITGDVVILYCVSDDGHSTTEDRTMTTHPTTARRQINDNDLAKIIADHELWQARRGKAGARADLRDTDLRDANLRDANLRGADLRGVCLREADLSGADLNDANLRGADLRGADLRYANLRGADLRGADMRDADLSNAYKGDAIIDD